jgi:hypothetical protein
LIQRKARRAASLYQIAHVLDGGSPVTNFVLALIAFAFISFAAVLSSVSIHIAMAERADSRRRNQVLDAFSRAARERLANRSFGGRVHAEAG